MPDAGEGAKHNTQSWLMSGFLEESLREIRLFQLMLVTYGLLAYTIGPTPRNFRDCLSDLVYKKKRGVLCFFGYSTRHSVS